MEREQASAKGVFLFTTRQKYLRKARVDHNTDPRTDPKQTGAGEHFWHTRGCCSMTDVEVTSGTDRGRLLC